MRQNQKNVVSIIVVLVIVSLIGIGYFVSIKQSDSRKEWKTFTNKLGYSFQYPPSLKAVLLKDTETVILRSTENKDSIEDFEFDSTISVLKNENRLPLKEFIEKREGVVNGQIPSKAEHSGTPFFRKVITFEKKADSVKPEYFFRADPCSICRGETYRTYIELSPTAVINFDIFVDKEMGNIESHKLYDQILSTFKFKEEKTETH